jgi:hypothetical protein
MLGEQIVDMKGKITSQRVLDSEGPAMETSVSFTGRIRGTQAKVLVTFVGKPTSTKGVIHGVGNGVIMAGESEIATYNGKGVGRITPRGSVDWRGAHFYRTKSTGELAFLNNIVGAFEAEIDADGNVKEKVWEWK